MRRLGMVGFLAVAASTAAASSQPAGTVALWHMDERSGSTMHDAAGRNYGRLHAVKRGLPGWQGTAYGFNGRSSYISVPSSSALNPGLGNLSFTVHLRYTVTPPRGSTTDYDVLRKGNSGISKQFYKLEVRHDNQAVCRFVGSNADELIHAGPKLNDGRWHTVTCSKTRSTIRLRVDRRTYTLSKDVGSISNDAALVIGAKPGNDYYNGHLDESSVTIE